jgi:hypothetical protein
VTIVAPAAFTEVHKSRAEGEDIMKNDHFFDGGKLIGSFVLVLLIGCALENFAGKAFGALLGNALAVFLMAIATLAFRLLWMWVEGSNVTLSLWGKRCRLTVGSLFVCAGAFLAVSFMFSWLAWLAAPSSKGAKSYSRSSSSSEYRGLSDAEKNAIWSQHLPKWSVEDRLKASKGTR